MPVDTRLFHCRALAIAMAVGGCATNPATAAPAKPEPAPNVVTSAHVAKLRSVGGAEISPDGRHIAFTLRVQRRPFVDDNGPAYSESEAGEGYSSSDSDDEREIPFGAVALAELEAEELVVEVARRGDEPMGLVLDPDNGVVAVRPGTPAASCREILAGERREVGGGRSGGGRAAR